MADMIITFKIMPEEPDTDLNKIFEELKEFVEKEGGKTGNPKIQEIAFGLKSLEISFAIDERKGTEMFEDVARNIDGVGSVEVIGITRALG
ncbi:MAG: hypothetical protein AABX29_05355 [Nanoarchaeota archaeon]